MTYKLQKITAKHRHAAYLISLGMSNKEAAIRVGVKPETIGQWKQSKLFRTLINKAYEDRREEVMDEFVIKAKKVQSELEKIALGKDVPFHVKRKAISDWLDRAGMKISPKILEKRITQELRDLEKKKETKKIMEYLEKNPRVKKLLSDIYIQVSKKAE